MKFKRFNFKKEPMRFKWWLRPVASAIALPAWFRYRPKVHYMNGVENLKAPFILLCNHNAFLDFKIAYPLLRGKYPNFVVAIDGYIGREWLMRWVGCICKRKFTSDIGLLRNLRKVIQRGDVPVIYPEARYSLCGTTAVLPESLGKMVKHFGVPIATLICHGHHVNAPFWNSSHERGIDHDEVDFNLLFTEDDIKSLSVDEINDKLVEAFQYDDFAWQRDNHIRINDRKRTIGLDKVLYQCPHCGTEYKMNSSGATLRCNACGKSWTMDEYGLLHAEDGETEFSHIPDWYEWERKNVRREVREGRYSTGVLPVKVKSLPNTHFIKLGEGEMVHDMSGLHVRLYNPPADDTAEIFIRSGEQYSLHIEYRYLFKHGDCIDINTLTDTWYVFPHDCSFAVTKMALATEELYFLDRERKGRPCRPGLA